MAMMCDVCAGINFKPLSEWRRPDEETNDNSNAAFRLYNTSDRAVEEWKRGEGMLMVYYFHHQSATDLLASASKGCYLCAMISYALFTKDNQLGPTQLLSLPAPPTINKPIIMTLFLSMQCRSWQTVEAYESIRVFCGSIDARLDSLGAFTKHPLSDKQYSEYCLGLEAAWKAQDMDPFLSTWSTTNQTLAKSWYRSCLWNHEGCASSDSVLPKRVIDIGDPGKSSPPVLIEPERDTHAKYITLSHCWGVRSRIRAMPTGNEKVWSLPSITDWPPLFRDAALVARTFHIRYLWIDAVCILQDSDTDWQIEAGRMAQYYSNSAFTIAAAASSSSEDGLVVKRNPIMTFPYHLKLRSRASDSPFFERYLCVGTEEIALGEAEVNLDSSVLYSRGWVLQEELLSPRVLRFGKKGIYWQCRSQSQSEGLLYNDQLRLKREVTIPLSIQLPDEGKGWTHSRNTHHDAWYKLLARFNRRNITYQKDVLPALSGISQVIHNYLPPDEQYLAGIWRSDWIVGLLWCKVSSYTLRPDVSPMTTNFDKKSLCAPSWSWVLSAHRALCFELHPKISPPGGVLLDIEQPNTKLVNTHITLQNDASPFGAVKFGALTFSAKCPHITIFLGKKPVMKVSSEAQNLEVRGTPFSPGDYYHDMKSSAPVFSGFTDTGIHGDCILDADEPNLAQRYNPLNFFSAVMGRKSTLEIHATFLPLLTYNKEDGSDFYVRNRTLGLALVPVDASELPPECGNLARDNVQVYRRIGRAALHISGGNWDNSPLLTRELIVI